MSTVETPPREAAPQDNGHGFGEVVMAPVFGERSLAPQRGVMILVHNRPALFKQAFVTDNDESADNLPLAGYVRAATSQYYGAYVRC